MFLLSVRHGKQPFSAISSGSPTFFPISGSHWFEQPHRRLVLDCRTSAIVTIAAVVHVQLALLATHTSDI